MTRALNAYHGLNRASWTHYTPQESMRMRDALEAVAAHIWDEGWEQGMAYVVGMERGTDDNHAITNPYRASETA